MNLRSRLLASSCVRHFYEFKILKILYYQDSILLKYIPCSVAYLCLRAPSQCNLRKDNVKKGSQMTTPISYSRQKEDRTQWEEFFLSRTIVKFLLKLCST